MQLGNVIRSSITFVVGLFTFSDFMDHVGVKQDPLMLSPNRLLKGKPGGPIFKPPGGRLSGPGSDFVCDYSQMVGFTSCFDSTNRSCWLENGATTYDINTDYENHSPQGVDRYYTLDITDDWVNADGLNFTEAKIFNEMYPGPWIQACWGDRVSITVNNLLRNNGTSIHWHGIRQLLTMHMDGVNGVTQCPIAPGDSFTYTWNVTQYGSSWYHSHYSVQYADGAIGPITLHGPSSASYDEAELPILMTDWGHNSAFQMHLENPSILLNGLGNITRYNNSFQNTLPIPEPYTLNFDSTSAQPKQYLLRLINTAFDSTFNFSIDNHHLQVISADFVPIVPYNTTSILVAIGQRYDVIVAADPDPTGGPLPEDGNYWIRTWRTDCFGEEDHSPGYETTGIIRYGESSGFPNTTAWPNIHTACADEPYDQLVPIMPWNVGPAANGIESLSVQGKSDQGTIYPLAFFSLGSDNFDPLRIDYGDPTFLNLNYTGAWDPLWVVFPENYTDTDWVYLTLKGYQDYTFGAHPIHLHGHDFAILYQNETDKVPTSKDLKTDNPPRRDVVLLPANGYVVIAFKTDNPGSWLMHCHIAEHASSGLAMQILERQQAAADIWPTVTTSHALQAAQGVCNNWNKWWGDCNNWWPGDGSSCILGNEGFSPDSGI
ncbi:Lcc2 [Phlyctema vagabunda]|uniref:Lcc2 n=1 Tax=Phlyctema vagabunda TaxID=108571 RepID=A0ABR4P247_9HELO